MQVHLIKKWSESKNISFSISKHAAMEEISALNLKYRCSIVYQVLGRTSKEILM